MLYLERVSVASRRHLGGRYAELHQTLRQRPDAPTLLAISDKQKCLRRGRPHFFPFELPVPTPGGAAAVAARAAHSSTAPGPCTVHHSDRRTVRVLQVPAPAPAAEHPAQADRAARPTAVPRLPLLIGGAGQAETGAETAAALGASRSARSHADGAAGRAGSLGGLVLPACGGSLSAREPITSAAATTSEAAAPRRYIPSLPPAHVPRAGRSLATRQRRVRPAVATSPEGARRRVGHRSSRLIQLDARDLGDGENGEEEVEERAEGGDGAPAAHDAAASAAERRKAADAHWFRRVVLERRPSALGR